MTVTVDFIPFATGVGAGVKSQAAWISDVVVTNGFVTGIAQSTQVNKAVRQPSFVASAISNFVGNVINQNILDNGVLNTYWSQFWQSILNAPSFVDTGSVNALVIAAPGSLTFPSPIAGLCIAVKVAATSTGGATLNWMGTGNKNITYPNGAALIGGELSSGGYSTLIFDGTNWQLTEISPNAFLARGYGNRAVTITTNYSVVSGDGGKNINCNAANLVVTLTSGYLTSNNGPVIIGTYSGYTATVSAGSGVFVGSSLNNQTSVTIVSKGWIAVQPDGTNFRIVAGDPSTLGASSNFLIGGNLTVSGTSTYSGLGTFSGGAISTASDASGAGGQFRATSGNFGVFIRNDGSACYLMQTASGNSLGTFNGFRPFAWNLTSGAVTIDGSGAGVAFGGGITVAATMTANISRATYGAFNSGDLNRAVILNDFQFGASANGYCRMPNGFIIQWGTAGAGVPSDVSFPVVFPNAFLNMVVTEGHAGGVGGSWATVNPTVHGVTNSTSTTSYYEGWAYSWVGGGAGNWWTHGSITQNFMAVGY